MPDNLELLVGIAGNLAIFLKDSHRLSFLAVAFGGEYDIDRLLHGVCQGSPNEGMT